ncbi:hypothetical protein OS493_006457 [Desmophyllum pertusum]|uniref:Peptidase M48 domain-containing protein n=1 Tax=Desmophyllum pertusum TaxID=174260 RepID=A0A9X0DBE7_9CNID|nr:hypothetical protein OS493_006457 [Desmophyllum pertusum]
MSSIFMRVAVGLTTGTLICLKAVPHVFPHEYVKRTMELKVDSTEVAVPLRCMEQLARIAPKLGVNDKHEKISFFVCKSLFPLSAGATWLPNGAVIGVPLSFFFKQEQDIGRFQQIVHKDGQVPFYLQGKAGSKFKDTLLLSDDSVAFLIGHELSHIKSVHLASQVLLAPSWLYITYEVANKTRKLVPKAPIIIDGIFKVSLCLLSYLCYWRAQRYLNHYQEFKADEMCARSDRDVAVGGVDWMLKTMKFNSFMRFIHDRGTTRVKSSEGYTHPKLLERLRKLEVIVDEMRKGAF